MSFEHPGWISMQTDIHASAAKTLQIERNVGEIQLFQFCDNCGSAFCQLFKSITVNFDAKNRFMIAQADVVEAETAQQRFSLMNA